MKTAAIARVHAPAAVLVVALAVFGLALAFALVSHETRHHDSVVVGSLALVVLTVVNHFTAARGGR